MFSLRSGALLAAGLTLAGCGSTIHKKTPVGGVQTLSIDAKQRLFTVGYRKEGEHGERREVACAEPSPDALVASAATVAASGDILNRGSARAAGNFSEAAAELGARSQPIQIMRDGYYRLCEAYLNGAISSDDYRRIITNVDTALTMVMAIDALAGNKPAGKAKVTAGGSGVTINDNREDSSAPSAEIRIEGSSTTAQADSASDKKAISDEQAKQIVNLMREFLSHKRQVIKFSADRKHHLQHHNNDFRN
ncbi:hypothetical protein [Coralliovum pocilloporae]|uniref:hypothetical protein n=1 Tax=Coralliovum pocilloporae TaxID=3066369 RepID=UPI0033070BC5